MSIAEIKASISKLSPREQAELDLWLQEREETAIRRVHFAELHRMLEESHADFRAGRTRKRTSNIVNEIKADGRRR